MDEGFRQRIIIYKGSPANPHCTETLCFEAQWDTTRESGKPAVAEVGEG